MLRIADDAGARIGFPRIGANLTRVLRAGATIVSHHYSGPDFGFPRGDARLDLTDLYAFPKPGDPGRSILIMNAHPSSSLNPIAPTTVEPFAPDARYEIRIDTNGDAVAEVTYQVTFSSAGNGAQTATLRRFDASQSGNGQIIVDRVAVSTGHDARVVDGRGHRFFAGWRSDPFFFDVRGALDNMKFTGTDFFADKNVCSIALEVPSSELAPGAVGLWMRVLVHAGASDRWVQVERGGHPQIAVFLAGDVREAYHAAEPADDARFLDAFAHALEHAGGYPPNAARRTAEQLLPDILRYDPTRLASYPSNGRALTDDVIRFFLPILTNGKVADDNVGPHRDLLAEFPYVGPPHRA
jgi:hypothetical protein